MRHHHLGWLRCHHHHWPIGTAPTRGAGGLLSVAAHEAADGPDEGDDEGEDGDDEDKRKKPHGAHPILASHAVDVVVARVRSEIVVAALDLARILALVVGIKVRLHGANAGAQQDDGDEADDEVRQRRGRQPHEAVDVLAAAHRSRSASHREPVGRTVAAVDAAASRGEADPAAAGVENAEDDLGDLCAAEGDAH